MPKRRRKEKKKAMKGTRPSSYLTMPHYFPTEQVDLVKKNKPKKMKKKIA